MSTRPADTESAVGSTAWRERLFTTLQRRGAIAVLILVVAVSALVFDNFLTEQNLENIVLQGAFLGLIVVGMTFVLISGGIDHDQAKEGPLKHDILEVLLREE